MASRATSTEPRFVEDSPELAKARRRKWYRDEITDIALDLYEHDPDVANMKQARQKARQVLDEQLQVQKGLLDPSTGELTSKGREVMQEERTERKSARRPARRPRRGSTRRQRQDSAARRTARAVVRPFGSAASAGWTLFTAGLSLVLLYIVLRDADVLDDFTGAISSALGRFGDPFVPLIPAAGETIGFRTSLKGPNSKRGANVIPMKRTAGERQWRAVYGTGR